MDYQAQNTKLKLVKVYLRGLYTGVLVIGLDNNPYEMYFLVLQCLLNRYEKTGNEIDVGQLQILAIELPSKYKSINKIQYKKPSVSIVILSLYLIKIKFNL